ncbi:MAG: VOC family protein [Ignavibacteriales bacterium]|nr:VOC family protein [Ignavibacteriales bacterium]
MKGFMQQKIGSFTIVVKDYDEAIEFYTKKLSFKLLEDTDMGGGKRWVIVAPQGPDGCTILLAKATTTEQMNAIGNQTGGRVFIFLYTDDFWRDYEKMQKNGIEFTEKPREEDFGTVVVFKDLYGNKWDFIARKKGIA